MTVDRENYCPTIILCRQNDDDRSTPTSTFAFSLSQGVTPKLLSEISEQLGAPGEERPQLDSILKGLHRIFRDKDATLLEINSLARSSHGAWTCSDARFSFDDAAAKRQQDLFALRDTEQEVAEEVAAERYGLVYVRMDGNIGNVVNGAGLAMATNDAIGLHGGASANFLDAGGQATKETMMQAFGIIMRDERIKAILVNIYGGESALSATVPIRLTT